ncbi:hypothetical protein B2G71_18720 [Novosphingobium sp. PC22D]|uniref:hypothetical protein n=1 Tax=Novosphingobium sp. PC22D TaxID=1962403 RepID=UPI000BF016EB|nr:hypothetical protein [Novosphingobium sp. PC22D]PEQ11154.1 hypothetical protein B2G71_18720 [Novosphingobium sp. PC22D]
MPLIKGLIPGSLLTWIVAGVLGSNGSRGGFLDIARVNLDGHTMYWSWPLFLAATGLAASLYWMTD